MTEVVTDLSDAPLDEGIPPDDGNAGPEDPSET